MCPRCGKARPAPDRTLCRHCGEKRRKAERARCAKAKAAGILYGGRDAERCRTFARDRGRRRDRARRDARTCTRCGTHPPVEGGTVCEPCRMARRDREREQYAARRTAGLCGRCGTPAPSDAAYCDRCARSAGQTLKKKGEEYKKPPALRPAARTEAMHQTAAHHPRARPGVPRAPAGPGRVRASIAVCQFYHLELRSSRSPPASQSWDMGPVGRCSGLPGLRQAFPGPGGADPGYVGHRPVSGAGVRKLVSARYARFREFAPLRHCAAHPQEPSKPPYCGKCVATFHVLPDDRP